MRELTSHKVNGLNEKLQIQVLDEPGAGNACHKYAIYGCNDETRCLALLAIVEDRLKGFQSGQYACRENAIALTKIQEAMHWLKHRTEDRLRRGVEGTMKH